MNPVRKQAESDKTDIPSIFERHVAVHLDPLADRLQPLQVQDGVADRRVDGVEERGLRIRSYPVMCSLS